MATLKETGYIRTMRLLFVVNNSGRPGQAIVVQFRLLLTNDTDLISLLGSQVRHSDALAEKRTN